MESWIKKFQYRKIPYVAEYIRRPFREGLEIRTRVGKKTISISELGLGEKALLQKLKFELSKHLDRQQLDR